MFLMIYILCILLVDYYTLYFIGYVKMYHVMYLFYMYIISNMTSSISFRLF